MRVSTLPQGKGLSKISVPSFQAAKNEEVSHRSPGLLLKTSPLQRPTLDQLIPISNLLFKPSRVKSLVRHIQQIYWLPTKLPFSPLTHTDDRPSNHSSMASNEPDLSQQRNSLNQSRNCTSPPKILAPRNTHASHSLELLVANTWKCTAPPLEMVSDLLASATIWSKVIRFL
jgi:hypothetical protein